MRLLRREQVTVTAIKLPSAFRQLQVVDEQQRERERCVACGDLRR